MTELESDADDGNETVTDVIDRFRELVIEGDMTTMEWQQTTTLQEDENPLDDGSASTAEDMDRIDDVQPWNFITASPGVKAISEWEQFGTVKNIGGVHSGSIVLFLVEVELAVEEDGEGNAPDKERTLADGNTGMKFSGGQVYNPLSKKISRTEETTSDPEIASLPAMVSTLLMTPHAVEEKKTLVLWEKIRRSINKLHDAYYHASWENNWVPGRNAVRHEMFVLTDKMGTMDPTDPQDYLRSWKFSTSGGESSFLRQHIKILLETVKPLMTVFVNRSSQDELWELSTATKGMLLVHTEWAVKLAGVHPFQGRIMKKIRKLLPREAPGRRHHWHIPRHCLAEISLRDKEATGLPFGLATDLCCLPTDQASLSVTRPHMDDDPKTYTKLPPHVQMYHGTLKMGVSFPVTFMKATVQMNMLIYNSLDQQSARNAYMAHRENPLQTGNPPDYQPPKRGIFTPPFVQGLADCDEDILEALNQDIARVIVNAYDFEWYAIHSEKMKKQCTDHNTENSGSSRISHKGFRLAEFPATQKELETFIHNQNQGRRGTGHLAFSIAQKKPVKDLDQFIAFICGSMTSNKFKCKRWKKSLVRNLLEVADDYRVKALTALEAKDEEPTPWSQVELQEQHNAIGNEGAANPLPTRAGLLSRQHFQATLWKMFTSKFRRRDPDEDDSPSIIWHSTPTAMYRSPNQRGSRQFILQPMEIHPTEHLFKHTGVATSAHKFLLEMNKPKLPEPRFPHAKHPRSSEAQTYLNKMVSDGTTDFLGILRCRVLLYLGQLNQTFPNGVAEWVGKYLNHCDLTSNTCLHDFSLNNSAFQSGLKRYYTKLHAMSGKPWTTVYDEMRAEINKAMAAEKSTGRKRKRAQAAPRLLAAMRNMRDWDMEELNFRSLLIMPESLENQINLSLVEEGWQSVLQKHAVHGMITARFLDELKGILHKGWEELKRPGVCPEKLKATKAKLVKQEPCSPDKAAGPPLLQRRVEQKKPNPWPARRSY